MKFANKKKKKEAVALAYDEKTQIAPKVVAKGRGMVAENIIEKAKENDVPIQEDAALVELLGSLNMNATIPEELYQAVAEVFAFIYKTNREAGRK